MQIKNYPEAFFITQYFLANMLNKKHSSPLGIGSQKMQCHFSPRTATAPASSLIEPSGSIFNLFCNKFLIFSCMLLGSETK